MTMPQTTPRTIRLDAYELAGQDIATVDVERLHELSVGVRWPHRPADWDVLRALGHGIVALDEIGRVFSSGMWFPHGESCATIGMVITSPRLQTHGGGRWIMERILAECGTRRLLLNSTRAAYPLYVSLGFEPQGTVYQCQGFVPEGFEPDPSLTREVEPLPLGDLAEITALDAAAFGAPRPKLLTLFAQTAEASAIRRDGQLVGFAMRRPFGRGHVIGPLVATSDEDARALVAELLKGMGGAFVRLDTRQPSGPLREFLSSAALVQFDTVRTLTYGGALPAVIPGSPGTYGLAGHALS